MRRKVFGTGTSYTQRRGNFTRGEDRRGNKEGRAPLYPPGTPLGRINLVVTMELHNLLRVMGSGNATRGARTAVKLAARIMPLWMQDDDEVLRVLGQLFDGKKICRDAVSEAFARFERTLRSQWDDTALQPGPPPSTLSAPAEELAEDDKETDDLGGDIGPYICLHGVEEETCPACNVPEVAVELEDLDE